MAGHSNPRTEAVLRVVVGLAITLTGIIAVLFAVGFISGAIWMLVDVVQQFVKGDEGWQAGQSGVASYLERLFYWPFEIVQWVLFGDRAMPLTP